MMNIDEITSAIAELENGDTTLVNCQKLASLYTVKDHLSNVPTETTVPEQVVSEYSDILPSYHMYCTIKRDYQLNRVTESAVLDAMHKVSIEIIEFLQILYSNTDMQGERDELTKPLKSFIANLGER